MSRLYNPSSSTSSTSCHPTPLPFDVEDDVFSAPLPPALDLTRPFISNTDTVKGVQISSSPSPQLRDPVSSLARSKTPFFLAFPQSPPSPPRRSSISLQQSPVDSLHEHLSGSTAWTPGGVGVVGDAKQTDWTSPGGVQGSMGGLTKMDLVTASEVRFEHEVGMKPRADLAEQWRAAFNSLSDPTLDTGARIEHVINIISSLHTRVSALERENAIQEVELGQLRALVRRPGQATPDKSYTPPRATTPTSYTFPYYQQSSPTQLQAQARPFDPTLVQTPSPSALRSNFASPMPFPPTPSIPHSHSYPGYSPIDSLSYSPISAFSSPRPDFEQDSPQSMLMNRRRSRGPSEFEARRRDRGVSMSAFEAQAQWANQQQPMVSSLAERRE